MASDLAMKDYNKHSGPQWASIKVAFDLIDAAVRTMPLLSNSVPVTVLDLGSSEGKNAVKLVDRMAKGIRKRSAQSIPIQTFYNDLPGNNWLNLFAHLKKARERKKQLPAVYPCALASSFYKPVLPPKTVHLATCFNAILWMNRLPPVPIPNYPIYRPRDSIRPRWQVSPEAQDAFSGQAEKDWVRFLSCRARELVAGGQLVVGIPGADETQRCSDGIYDVFNDALLELVATGRITQSSYEQLVIPVYFRTVDELKAPLEGPDATMRKFFQLDVCELREVPVPFFAFRESGNLTVYAKDFTKFLQAFTVDRVRNALARTERDRAGFAPWKDRKDGVINELYDRVRKLLQNDPDRYDYHYVAVYMRLTRL